MAHWGKFRVYTTVQVHQTQHIYFPVNLSGSLPSSSKPRRQLGNCSQHRRISVLFFSYAGICHLCCWKSPWKKAMFYRIPIFRNWGSCCGLKKGMYERVYYFKSAKIQVYNWLKTCKSWNYKWNVESLSLGQHIQKTCVKLTDHSLYKPTVYIPVKKVLILYMFALKSKLLLKISRYP